MFVFLYIKSVLCEFPSLTKNYTKLATKLLTLKKEFSSLEPS